MFDETYCLIIFFMRIENVSFFSLSLLNMSPLEFLPGSSLTSSYHRFWGLPTKLSSYVIWITIAPPLLKLLNPYECCVVTFYFGNRLVYNYYFKNSFFICLDSWNVIKLQEHISEKLVAINLSFYIIGLNVGPLLLLYIQSGNKLLNNKTKIQYFYL